MANLTNKELLELPINDYNACYWLMWYKQRSPHEKLDARTCNHCGRVILLRITCICAQAQADWQKIVDEIREVNETLRAERTLERIE